MEVDDMFQPYCLFLIAKLQGSNLHVFLLLSVLSGKVIKDPLQNRTHLILKYLGYCYLFAFFSV